MKIVVNARWLISGKLEGFGWYTYHTMQRLKHLLPQATFYLLVDRKHKIKLVEFLNVTHVVVPPPARHPYLWTFWNNISVPIALKRLKADLYFSPDGFLPKWLKIPMITTIHDLNFETNDGFLIPEVEAYYRKHIRAAANKATHIVTVSEFTKQDVVEKYGIDASKITVTYNGAQTKFEDLRHQKRSTRQHYAASRPYFLFVGAQNPRKNLQRIFEAFDAYSQLVGSNNHLVLVGERMLWTYEIEEAFRKMKHQDRVHFTGRLSTLELNKVYSAATALVFPSLFEGFGMPIVEAFLAHTPVITSNNTAMKEIAADAALLVNPEQTEEIIMAMRQLSANPDICEDFIARGVARADFFKWEFGAKKLANKMRELIDAKKQ